MREALTFDDVLLVPNYCGFESRKEVDTSVTIGEFTYHLPIISANMDTITGSKMAEQMTMLGGLAALHRFCSIEDNVQMFKEAIEWSFYDCEYLAWTNVIASVGVNESLERFAKLYEAGARLFCVDVAHGHSKLVNKQIKAMKEYAKDVIIIAGNVASYAGADYLAGCGADIIKVGIGPGSVCTTRIKTGFGVPQLSAILDCARCSKPIIADGGVRTPGDVVKALAAGAKMVMLGGMLAGTDETPGEIKTYREGISWKEYKEFRGMASREAFEDFFGAMPDWKTAEGIATRIKCKGPVENVINDIIGGLRSGMTYAGAATLDELPRRVEFVRVTQAGRVESGAHINDRRH